MSYQWRMYKLYCRVNGINEHEYKNLKNWIEGKHS